MQGEQADRERPKKSNSGRERPCMPRSFLSLTRLGPAAAPAWHAIPLRSSLTATTAVLEPSPVIDRAGELLCWWEKRPFFPTRSRPLTPPPVSLHMSRNLPPSRARKGHPYGATCCSLSLLLLRNARPDGFFSRLQPLSSLPLPVGTPAGSSSLSSSYPCRGALGTLGGGRVFSRSAGEEGGLMTYRFAARLV